MYMLAQVVPGYALCRIVAEKLQVFAKLRRSPVLQRLARLGFLFEDQGVRA
jgi:hypothetical protein